MAQDSPPTAHNQTLLLPCHECDLVCDVDLGQHSGWLQCPRCRHPLMRQAQSDQLTPALAFTALILLGLSLLFPYIGFEKNGIERAMTVTDAAWELAVYHHPSLAVIVIATCASDGPICARAECFPEMTLHHFCHQSICRTTHATICCSRGAQSSPASIARSRASA